MNAFSATERWLLPLVAVLLLLAVFLNLGDFPLNSDGGLRGLTAMEMELGDEYIVPLQNGSNYFRKPPVFNWTIVAAHKLFGDWSNFTIRFPVALSLLLWALSIVLVLRKSMGLRNATLTALVAVTGGHMLFESSRYGRIDMVYSWIIWGIFMAVHYFYERERWWQLFLVAYGLAAVSFLTKGLPTVVFMGCTLMGWFFINKNWKRFFSLQHAAGGLLFFAIVGAYYWAYETRNPGVLHELIGALWTDSSERTMAHFGVGKTIGHLLLFPVRLLYEILPWSLLAIACIRKGWWKQVKDNSLLFYCAVVFVANILVYWTSPGNNTRYLLMFFPLLAVVLVHFYEANPLPSRNRIVVIAFRVILVLGALAVWAFPFLPDFADAPLLLVKCMAVSLAFAGAAYLAFRQPQAIVLIMVAGVLLARITFNWILTPTMAPISKDKPYQVGSETMAEITRGEPFFILRSATINTDVSAYITRSRNEILTRKQKGEIDNGTFFLIDEHQHHALTKKGVEWDELHTFIQRSGKTRIHLVKFRNYPEVME